MGGVGTTINTKGMAAIGTSVSLMSIAAPRLLLKILGLPPAQLTPAASFGLRLFAARTLMVCALAVGGNETARRMFLPLQALDQLAWWDMYRRGELGLRPTLTATLISGAIILLGLTDE